MGEEASARLELPFLYAGQAQKEGTHNEALARLDLAVQASVEAVALDAPPPAPDEGQCWIVGAAPTGAWAGHAGALAGWTGGGWRFVPPREGFAAWSAADARPVRFRAGTWRIDPAPRPAIAAPAGGAVADAEARAALAAVLEALRAHGLVAA
jgi:hypothetical protein